MNITCLIKGHDDRRIASIGGVVEIMKCRRCGRLALREF